MTKSFQPLLSATCLVAEIAKLRYPLLASPKLDGIRCVKLDGKALTRKLKPIPNASIREWVEANLPDGIDGELMLRDHRIPLQQVNSAVMSRTGEPDFVFHAFDLLTVLEPAEGTRWNPMIASEVPFEDRYAALKEWVGPGHTHLQLVPHVQVEDPSELQAVIDSHLEHGYEGTMVRSLHGRYKFGRSTLKEGILCKIKPWFDEEATVIGVVEAMENTNAAEIDERGYTKRSKTKDGRKGLGMLGTLVCRTYDGIEFEIGTGWTDPERVAIFAPFLAGVEQAEAATGIRPNFIAVGDAVFRPAKFKHLGRIAESNVPRGAVFLCWRED